MVKILVLWQKNYLIHLSNDKSKTKKRKQIKAKFDSEGSEPQLLFKSPCILEKIILDMPEDRIETIKVNDKKEYEAIKQMLEELQESIISNKEELQDNQDKEEVQIQNHSDLIQPTTDESEVVSNENKILGFKVISHNETNSGSYGGPLLNSPEFATQFVGISFDDVEEFILWAIPFGIIFARLYYVIFRWDNYKDDLGSIFDLRSGGIAIYGAIIGAVVAAFVFCKIKKKVHLLLVLPHPWV